MVMVLIRGKPFEKVCHQKKNAMMKGVQSLRNIHYHDNHHSKFDE